MFFSIIFCSDLSINLSYGPNNQILNYFFRILDFLNPSLQFSTVDYWLMSQNHSIWRNIVNVIANLQWKIASTGWKFPKQDMRDETSLT